MKNLGNYKYLIWRNVYCYIQTEILKSTFMMYWREEEREWWGYLVERGQILVLISTQRRIPRVERIFFMLTSEYGSTSRKVAMTPVSYEWCDHRSEFRVKESNPFNLRMDHVKSLKRARLNNYEVFRILKLKNERKK